MIPVVLTIAGSDSGGGAGIQADLLTFAAHSVFGTTAITALTAQNPESVTAVEAVSSTMVLEQVAQVFRYFPIAAVKTGMLFNAEIISELADFFKDKNVPIIVDPVMVATSGAHLLKQDAISALKTKFLPSATLITPNLDEAKILLEDEFIDASSKDSMSIFAQKISKKYNVSVLLKGGHMTSNTLYDIFYSKDENKEYVFKAEKSLNINSHGSGCTLSSAITANIAMGKSLHDAIQDAHSYLQNGIKIPLILNKDNFIAHLNRN